jgi:Domain of Unknown Function (DUF1259)
MIMGRWIIAFLAAAVLIACGTAVLQFTGAAAGDDMAGYWAPVQKAMGTNGTVYDDGTISFDIPRSIVVTLDGVKLAPGSDLSHEIHMMKDGNRAMVMGELVLTEDEVSNVTGKLIRAGINETALHNHMLRESPHLMYLHFMTYGDPVALATAIRDIVDPLAKGPAGSNLSENPGMTGLDQIMGARGEFDNGVYGFHIPRRDNISVDGMTLSPHMDISEEVSFQPLGNGKAAFVGELTLMAGEVEPVIKAFTDHGIEVTAVHSHMLTEQPRLFYLHAWATGDAESLARVARAALDRTNT